MVCTAEGDDNVNVGVGGAVPVPLNATVCGDPDALSATERAAEKLAAVAGIKVTEMEHELPAARELPQVLV